MLRQHELRSGFEVDKGSASLVEDCGVLSLGFPAIDNPVKFCSIARRDDETLGEESVFHLCENARQFGVGEP
jgi:hypothetical protein